MVDMTRRYRTNDNCNSGCNRNFAPHQRENESGMGMQMNCATCGSLKKKLQTVDFAIVETVLFLDAYPKNKQALEYYHKLIGERNMLEKAINEKYKDGTVCLEIKDSYRNMKEKIVPHIHLVENAKRAAVEAGADPTVEPIRGGTDGARLSFMGLPCPNLGTGGYAFHGPFEHITVEGMDIAVKILHNITKIYAQKQIKTNMS